MHTTPDLSEIGRWMGRLFMAGMPGPRMDRGTEALIREHALGGIILFARNIEDPVQLARLCSRLQATAMESQGVPLFLAVDQEGGRVARLRSPFTVFPGNSVWGTDPDGPEKALEFGRTTAREMRLVGLNMDMAPVVDVAVGPIEEHLKGRLFGDDPGKVAILGQCVIRGLQETGVMAVAKHFPGLGGATRDPHHDLPVIDADIQVLEEHHLPPFEAAVKQGVSAIMTSHALYPALDPQRPGTLSRRIVTGLIREKLGFDGLVISDDLEMGAINRGEGVAPAAVAAFAAGCDILLICKDQEAVLEGIKRVRDALLREEIPVVRLHQSLRRLTAAIHQFLAQPTGISLNEVRAHFGMEREGRLS